MSPARNTSPDTQHLPGSNAEFEHQVVLLLGPHDSEIAHEMQHDFRNMLGRFNRTINTEVVGSGELQSSLTVTGIRDAISSLNADKPTTIFIHGLGRSSARSITAERHWRWLGPKIATTKAINTTSTSASPTCSTMAGSQ